VLWQKTRENGVKRNELGVKKYLFCRNVERIFKERMDDMITQQSLIRFCGPGFVSILLLVLKPAAPTNQFLNDLKRLAALFDD